MEGSKGSAGVSDWEGQVMFVQHLFHKQDFLVDKDGVEGNLEGTRRGLNGRREGILRGEKDRGKGRKPEQACRKEVSVDLGWTSRGPDPLRVVRVTVSGQIS